MRYRDSGWLGCKRGEIRLDKTKQDNCTAALYLDDPLLCWCTRGEQTPSCHAVVSVHDKLLGQTMTSRGRIIKPS
jgi:hypothetical protein